VIERDVDETDSIVIVIDDDLSFRRSTERLIRSVGYSVQSFGTAAEFLRSRIPDVPACVVLDVRLPGLSGLDLQEALPKVGIKIPIIFITAHGDIPMSVQAMKAGAVEFLTKPFRSQDLLAAIQLAIATDRETRKVRARLAVLRARYQLLTAREREVMASVVSGLLNKQIAGELSVT
jgi:FixJ family two-component response regulator